MLFRSSDRRGGWLPEAELVDLSASKPELSRVEEDKLPAKLDGAERKALLKNGFYVDPKPVLVKELNEDDMVDAYNTIDSLTPRFITADLPLHAFHLYFDRMLQKVEQKALLPRTFELLSAMNEALKDLPDNQNIFWDTNLREYSIIDKEIVSKIQSFLHLHTVP